jgi:hypothetical protein
MRMARSSHNPAPGRNLPRVTWRRVTVSLLALLALAVPAAALARTAVTGATKTPIVRAALGAQVPRQCAVVYLSTVNRSWSSTTFHPQHGWAARCQKYGSNGVAILHRARSRWRVVTEGSDFSCPIRHVPAAVTRDLGVSCH